MDPVIITTIEDTKWTLGTRAQLREMIKERRRRPSWAYLVACDICTSACSDLARCQCCADRRRMRSAAVCPHRLLMTMDELIAKIERSVA